MQCLFTDRDAPLRTANLAAHAEMHTVQTTLARMMTATEICVVDIRTLDFFLVKVNLA